MRLSVHRHFTHARSTKPAIYPIFEPPTSVGRGVACLEEIMHNEAGIFAGPRSEVLCPAGVCGVIVGASPLHPGVANESGDLPDLRTADFSRQGRYVVQSDGA